MTITPRKALALAVLAVTAAAAALVVAPAYTGSEPDTRALYAPDTSAVATTADNPPRWVLVDHGVQWLPGSATQPYVTCALGTPDGSIQKRFAIDPEVWRTTSAVAYVRGVTCPPGRELVGSPPRTTTSAFTVTPTR